MFAFMPMNHEFGNCLSTPMLNSHFAFCLQVFHQAGPPKQDLGNNATRGFCRQAAWGGTIPQNSGRDHKNDWASPRIRWLLQSNQELGHGSRLFQKFAAFGEKHFSEKGPHLGGLGETFPLPTSVGTLLGKISAKCLAKGHNNTLPVQE